MKRKIRMGLSILLIAALTAAFAGCSDKEPDPAEVESALKTDMEKIYTGFMTGQESDTEVELSEEVQGFLAEKTEYLQSAVYARNKIKTDGLQIKVKLLEKQESEDALQFAFQVESSCYYVYGEGEEAKTSEERSGGSVEVQVTYDREKNCVTDIYEQLNPFDEEHRGGYDIAKIRENLEDANDRGEDVTDTLLARVENENKLLYSIKKEDAAEEAFQQLDLSSDTYHSEAEEIMEKTDPKVLLQYIENQCEKAVLTLSDLEDREVSYICDEKDEQGNTDILKIYDLGEGTVIILWETDCKDDSVKNGRNYTVSYIIMVGSTMQGKFSVTNHYTIDKDQIILRDAEVKEYNGDGPLTVELRDKPWKSSLKSASQIGDEVYAGAAFDLTCSKDVIIGSDKAPADKSKGVSWNENRTRLHKIFAAVKVKDMQEDGISAERYGKLRCLK